MCTDLVVLPPDPPAPVGGLYDERAAYGGVEAPAGNIATNIPVSE